MSNATTKNPNTQKEILALAEQYLDAGIWTIPIKAPIPGDSSSGKTPKNTNWPTEKLTIEQFKKHHKPGDNIGVVCGKNSNLICIDIDATRGGMKWFIEHESELGNFLLENTGGGGKHLYYRYPAGVELVPSSKDRIAPGVEVAADGGRQVVTAPSAHFSGGIYSSANVTLLDLADFDELPKWLLMLIMAQSKGVDITPSLSFDLNDHSQDIERAIEILKVYAPAIEGQCGDQQTFQAACLCRDYGLKPATTYKLMMEHFNPRCMPPWSEKELKTKVKNAYQYAKGGAGSKGLDAVAEQFKEPAIKVKAKPEDVEAMEDEIVEMEEKAAKEKGNSDPYKLKDHRACANLWLKDWGGTVQFIGEQGFIYNSTKWDFTDKTTIERGIEKIICAANKKKKPSNYNLREIYQHIKRDKTDLGLSFEHENQWLTIDTHRDYVALKNGILNLRTKELVSHHQDWFSFNCLPFGYDPAAQESKAWDDFLSSVWPEESKLKELLQLWIGYLILGHLDQQKFALLVGASRAGKGTVVNVVTNLIGRGNCGFTSLTALGGDFGMQPLLGKKLIILPDVHSVGGNPNLATATERLISIVGADSQGVNRKNMSMIMTQLPGRIMLTCNEMPPLLNHRFALTNRMIAFPFEKSFAGKEDLELGKKLKKELPAIFNWALVGVERILAGERLVNAPMGNTTITDIIADSDSVLTFIRDRVRTVPIQNGVFDNMQNKLTSKEAYDAYANFCQDTGRFKKGEPTFYRTFAREMQAAGREKKDIKLNGKTVKAFVGVRIISIVEELEALEIDNDF